MWTSIIQEADAVYFPDEPKRPTRLSSESKNIKENLLKYRDKNCKFLCEISSVKGTRVGSFYDIEESPYIYPIWLRTRSTITLTSYQIVLNPVLWMLSRCVGKKPHRF